MRRLLIVIAALVLLLAACEWTTPSGQTTRFGDEFTGTSLNTTAWHSSWLTDVDHSGANNDEIACWSPSHVTESNSQLHLTLTDDTCSNGQSWTGAGVTSKWDTSQQSTTNLTWHFEARVRFPNFGGVYIDWPAFWVNGVDTAQNCWPQWGELDVAEVLGNTALRSTTHYGTSCDAGTTQGPTTIATANDDNFHTYSVDTVAVSGSCSSGYTNVQFTYKRDGSTAATHTACVLSNPAWYVVLNNTCGAHYGGTCGDGSTMDVEYVFASSP